MKQPGEQPRLGHVGCVDAIQQQRITLDAYQSRPGRARPGEKARNRLPDGRGVTAVWVGEQINGVAELRFDQLLAAGDLRFHFRAGQQVQAGMICRVPADGDAVPVELADL